MKKFVKEFREFINRGNVIDLAVAVIIGAAFTAIVNSLVGDLITPLLSLVTQGIDFSTLSVTFGSGANAATFRYGSFIQSIINFIIIALVIFFLVKAVNIVARKKTEETKTCPYCLQTVPLKATRCPHCTSELEYKEPEHDASADGGLFANLKLPNFGSGDRKD